MEKESTVFILGAGFNQCVNDWNGLKPPLATDFFQTILKSDKYQSGGYSRLTDPIYQYIAKFWKKTEADLLAQPFDLEECFTFIELQYYESAQCGDKDKATELATINFNLKTLLAEFLSEFEIFSFQSEPLRDFARKIYEERHPVITFNYDCILEDAIKSASGVCQQIPASFLRPQSEDGELPDDILAYSHCNWNPPLGYGFKFDEIQLQQAGVSRYVDGHRFYSHPKNTIYDWKILKLHGSLNWFHYLQPMHPALGEYLPLDKRNNIVLMGGHWHFGMPPIMNGWFVDPLIITPQLYKEKYYETDLFSNLWAQAKGFMEKCTSLVIIGYSFPPTDFAVRKLLLESFANTELKDLVVVNPDTSVVRTIKQIVHFTKPVLICHDLEEFLKHDLG
jgi:hypothetical protein